MLGRPQPEPAVPESRAPGDRSGPWLAAAVCVAVVLRLPRVVLRWDEVSLAYAAYTEPAAAAVAAGQVGTALGAWVGLHPPLHAMWMGLCEVVWPAPLLWLGASMLATVGAVWLVGRVAGPVASLVLATAPLQLAYCAEVNNYPLAVFAVAAVMAAARAHWAWLAGAAILCGWSHVLAGAAAGGVVLLRLLKPRRDGERPRLILACVLGLAPVAVGVLRLTQQDTTFTQPPLDAAAWVAGTAAAVGPEGWVLAVVAALGLRRGALAAWLPAALVLGASLVLAAAAPHQRPYLALLGPPVAVGVAWGARRYRRWAPLLVGGVVVLCGIRGLRGGAGELAAAQAVLADLANHRAVDVAVEQSRPGDTVWLVAPALQEDDDKTDASSVLWRLDPWMPMPLARPVPFEYRDWTYGQPRAWRGRVVHTSTELAPAPFDHVAQAALERGGRVWVVLYDHGPAVGLDARLERVMRPYDAHHQTFAMSHGLGDDHLWRVDGLVP